MKLQDKLNSLDKYPFHMPGHKRNEKFGIIGANIDITEIDGADDLHNPSGVLLDVEDKLAQIYRAKKSFMLVNGSTVGILSAIHALCSRGDKIIIARNCHKSVFNACMLLELNVVYIDPQFDFCDGYYTRVEQSDINLAIKDNPDARAVVITSPTYEGNISNITSSIPLIIDAAHGAHLGMSFFPSYQRADIVVSSLHKTLPALTQTAVINVYNADLIGRVKRFVDVFETSSPSYVLMNSVADCVDYVLNNRGDFDDYYARLMDFRCDDLHCLTLKYNDDPSKVVISTSSANITGTELASRLRDEYNIEVEMASSTYVILMTSVADEQPAFDSLRDALQAIDDSLLADRIAPVRSVVPAISQASVIKYPDCTEDTLLDNCVGRVSAEFVFAYPPDIPILTPNAVITSELVEYIKNAISSGVNIVSDSGQLPNSLLTKRL